MLLASRSLPILRRLAAHVACAFALLLGGLVLDGAADELVLDSADLWRFGRAEGLRRGRDARSLELARGVLLEDDGPAAGYSYRPNEESLRDGVLARKELPLDDPRTDSATLLVGATGSPRVRANDVDLATPRPSKVGGYWLAYDVPPEALRAGANRFVATGAGKDKLWIARDDDFAAGSTTRTRHPNRSAKSRDGGATWSDSRLGTGDDVDGEYYVRMFLDRHVARGVAASRVVDAGDLAGSNVAPPLTSVGAIVLRWKGEAGDEGAIRLRARSGGTPTPDGTWSGWTEWTAPGEPALTIESPRGRYVQCECELSTRDPRRTPRLEAVVVTARPERPADWTKQLETRTFVVPPRAVSTIPFAYESFDHPALRALRDRLPPDVAASDPMRDFDQIAKLARWASRQWKKGHLSEAYPRWNALDILAPHADGTPTGGFCQQFNVVLLQACQSLGIPGRCVSIGAGDHGLPIRGGGHEVVELWSNQYEKWVYVDGDMAWYFVDVATRTPLSLHELRQRQLRAWRKVREGDESWSTEGTEVVQLDEPKRVWRHFGDWPPLAELRMIPRSDFLATPAPLPLNQGMRGWFWTGHYAWSDDEHPASQLYDRRVEREVDWDWPLHVVQMTLAAQPTPGEVLVTLGAGPPERGEYVVRIDGREARGDERFTWRLRAGGNRMSVRLRTPSGRLGPPAEVSLQYAPPR